MIIFEKKAIMSKESKIMEEKRVTEEPAATYQNTKESLKSDILKLVENIEDEKVLRVVWNILQEKKSDNNSVNLSRHLQDIFNQYPETLQKLAQ